MTGWSIDLIRESLETVFENKGINWKLEFPDRMLPTVYIHMDKDIPSETKRAILKLFPDGVHVWFNVMSIPDQGDIGGNTD